MLRSLRNLLERGKQKQGAGPPEGVSCGKLALPSECSHTDTLHGRGGLDLDGVEGSGGKGGVGLGGHLLALVGGSEETPSPGGGRTHGGGGRAHGAGQIWATIGEICQPSGGRRGRRRWPDLPARRRWRAVRGGARPRGLERRRRLRRRSSQDSPSIGRHFGSDTHEVDSEEPSSIGHGDLVRHNRILQWAKAKKYGSLQVVCQYYQLQCPARGSSLTFHPLEHLHPLSFHRPGETVLHIAGSTIELRSRDTSLEVAEMRNALFAEEESTALSIWAVASICGCLRLEHVMTLFAAALLEKQIVIVCSNLGMLSASVLSIVPLIRPYQWQSLLMPVLPADMMDFLDAPVPYIVGVQNKTSDVLNRLANAVVIDANRNQIKSASVPQLPQQKELLSALRPYHSRLVGESYLARKRPVYECTDAQVVSLLLKESFIGSFPSRDRPFMKVLNCIGPFLFSFDRSFVLGGII
ncbi:hypothetical protein PR202_ga02938 [Eleusine coracana subsp. coracana]|uniref:UDENN domain-containing protein n=1 Tax=Eleusine coracana subsp. coracana TaxID=191504 RepID=A0AAV5BM30_ELECO|nr:hypothetical protein PR202_ga02938 [Eleusine coracana subsp. coracana]